MNEFLLLKPLQWLRRVVHPGERASLDFDSQDFPLRLHQVVSVVRAPLRVRLLRRPKGWTGLGWRPEDVLAKRKPMRKGRTQEDDQKALETIEHQMALAPPWDVQACGDAFTSAAGDEALLDSTLTMITLGGELPRESGLFVDQPFVLLLRGSWVEQRGPFEACVGIIAEKTKGGKK